MVIKNFPDLNRKMIVTNKDETMSTLPNKRPLSPSSIRYFPDDTPNEKLTSSIKTKVSSPSSRGFKSSSKKRVSFNRTVAVKCLYSKKNPRKTEEEIKNYWYQDDEYQRMWDRNDTLVRLGEIYHSRQEPLPTCLHHSIKECKDDIEKRDEGDFLCIRGLEACFEDEYFNKKEKRRDAIHSVLIEQECQYLEGSYDEQAIADVYSKIAAPRVFRAVWLAMEDRIKAKEYCRDVQ